MDSQESSPALQFESISSVLTLLCWDVHSEFLPSHFPVTQTRFSDFTLILWMGSESRNAHYLGGVERALGGFLPLSWGVGGSLRICRMGPFEQIRSVQGKLLLLVAGAG